MSSSRDPLALFLIDGMRPDAIAAAPMPNLQRLIAAGASSLAARTVEPSLTLPCITSLFFSQPPSDHAVLENTWNPSARRLTGLFDLFHAAGRSTASIYNYEPLRDLGAPDALDAALCLNIAELPQSAGGAGDVELTDLALALLARRSFDFTFIYLGCPDTAGHLAGWMSQSYLQALEVADACLGRLLLALPLDVRVAVLADHGGHDHSHGTSDPLDMTIPLVFAGPGIPAGAALPAASILDTAPTLASLAGLDVPAAWQGRRLI